jgi:hypothetical protein
MKDLSLRTARYYKIPIAEYKRRIAAGLKHCCACRQWHPVSIFGVDKSSCDGLTSMCKYSWRIKGPKLWQTHPHPRGMKGKKLSSKSKRLMSIAHSGSRAWNWKKGISLKTRGARHSKSYAQWRRRVLARDKYQCRKCGNENTLHAHHIKSFAAFPKLRYRVGNGLTLCEPCHKAAHK